MKSLDKQDWEKKVYDLCKTLYILGENTGKNKLSYYPKPHGYYADKINKIIQSELNRQLDEILGIISHEESQNTELVVRNKFINQIKEQINNLLKGEQV